jgi:hypothetical protein
MLDGLPARVRKNESSIINLDDTAGPGTHWVCFKKFGDRVVYFDSYGNLRPPPELVKYWGRVEINYNRVRYQRRTFDCGHRCIEFLVGTTG